MSPEERKESGINSLIQQREKLLLRLRSIVSSTNLTVGEHQTILESIKSADQYILTSFSKWFDILEKNKKVVSDTSDEFDNIIEKTNEFDDELSTVEDSVNNILKLLAKAKIIDSTQYKNLQTKLIGIHDVIESNNDALENSNSIVDDLNNSHDLTAGLIDKNSDSVNRMNMEFGKSLDKLNEFNSGMSSVMSGNNSVSIDVQINDISKELEAMLDKSSNISGDISNIGSNITDSEFQLQSAPNLDSLNLKDSSLALKEELRYIDNINTNLNESTKKLLEEIKLKGESLNFTKDQVGAFDEIIKSINETIKLNRISSKLELDRLNLIEKYGGTYSGAMKGVSQAIQNTTMSIDRFISNLPGGDALSRAFSITDISREIDKKLVGSFDTFLNNVQFNGMSAFKALKFSIVDIGKSIIKALGPIGLTFVALTAGLAIFNAINDVTKKISENLGLSRKRSWDLYRQSVNIQSSLANQLATHEDILETMRAASSSSGIMLFDSKEISKISNIGKAMGYGVEQAAKLNSLFKRMGVPKDMAPNFQLIVGRMAEAEGFSSKFIMDDIIENSGRLAEYFIGYPKNLVKSVIEIRKMGVSIDKAMSIADNLLDIESSLTAEFEASAAIGRQLNLQKARQLAIEGDIAGATQEVVNQIGSRNDLEKMSYMQRRLVAKALGLEVEEMTRVFDVQSKIAKLPEEQREAAAKYAETMENIGDMSDDMFVNELGRLQATEKLEAQWDKIKQQLLVGLMPIAEAFSELLSDLAPILTLLVPPIKLIGRLLGALKPVIDGIVLPFRFIGAIIDTINELFDDTVATGTAFKALMGDIADKFSGLFSIFSGIGNFILSPFKSATDETEIIRANLNKTVQGSTALGISLDKVSSGFGSILEIAGNLFGIFIGTKMLKRVAKFFGFFKGTAKSAITDVAGDMLDIVPKKGIFSQMFNFKNLNVGGNIKKIFSNITSFKIPSIKLSELISTGNIFDKTKDLSKKLSKSIGPLRLSTIFDSKKINNFKGMLSDTVSFVTDKVMKITPVVDDSKLNISKQLGDEVAKASKLLSFKKLMKFDFSIGKVPSKMFDSIKEKILSVHDKMNLNFKFNTKNFKVFDDLSSRIFKIGKKMNFSPKFSTGNLKKFSSSIGKAFEGITGSIFKVFGKNKFGTLISKSFGGISKGIFKVFGKKKFSKMLLPLLLDGFTSMDGDIMSSLSSTIVNTVPMIGDMFSSIGKKSKSVFSGMMEAGKSVFSNLRTISSNLFSNMKTAGSGIFKSLFEKMSTIAPAIIGKIKMIGPSLSKTLGDIAGNISGAASKVVSKFSAGTGTKALLKTNSKAATKVAGKGILKSVGKKIPVIGALIGAGLSIDRLVDGDYVGAGLELVSGLSGTLPGLGTAASIGVDAALMARDISRENKSMKEEQINAADTITNFNKSPEITIQSPKLEMADDTKNIQKTANFNQYTGDLTDVAEKSYTVSNTEIYEGTKFNTISPAETMPVINNIQSNSESPESKNKEKTKTESPVVDIDLGSVEKLLKELISSFNGYASRPITVSIGDGTIRKINQSIRTSNAL